MTLETALRATRPFARRVRHVSLILAGVLTLTSGHASADSTKLNLNKLAAQHGVCAASAAIIKDFEVVTLISGTGCDTPRPGPDAVFQAASLGKPLFAYAVWKLAAQRRIDLDAPLLNYLPGGYAYRSLPFIEGNAAAQAVQDPRMAQITARMVLRHTAGLPNWSGDQFSFVSTPGERWSYSGEGFVMLQRAVEVVAQRSLDDLMTAEIFEPLGMTSSSYRWRPGYELRMVAARPPEARAAAPVRKDLLPIAAVTLHTTARDYAKFMTAVLRDAPALRAISESGVAVEPQLGITWGLGWGLADHAGDRFIWHWGNNPGYKSFAMASVKTGNGFVVFTNSDNGIALARSMAAQTWEGDSHPLFRFYMLREGAGNWLCKKFDLCR